MVRQRIADTRIDHREIARLLGLKPDSSQAGRAAHFCEDVRKETTRLRAERKSFSEKKRDAIRKMQSAIQSLEEAAASVNDLPVLLVHLPPLKKHLRYIDQSRVRHRPTDHIITNAILALANLYAIRTGRRATSTREGPFAQLITLVLEIEDPPAAIRRALKVQKASGS